MREPRITGFPSMIFCAPKSLGTRWAGYRCERPAMKRDGPGAEIRDGQLWPAPAGSKLQDIDHSRADLAALHRAASLCGADRVCGS